MTTQPDPIPTGTKAIAELWAERARLLHENAALRARVERAEAALAVAAQDFEMLASGLGRHRDTLGSKLADAAAAKCHAALTDKPEARP